MGFLTVPVGPLQCNCYVLWDDPKQAVIIDPGDEGERLVQLLISKGVTPSLILNTHGHFDHVGGVDAVRAAFGARYKIHEADIPILNMIPARTKLWGITVGAIPTPSEFVAPGERFRFADLAVLAIHTPGHTPGSTCYYVAQMGAVFTGDTLFAGSIGRTDFPGGDMDQILESIRERLLSLPPDTKVYPGHGPASSIEQEAENNPFLT